MARVILTDSISKAFTAGVSELEIPALNVRQLIRQLDERYPGLGAEVNNGALSVAIDGDIYQDAFLEDLKPNSEVAFLPKIGGG
ncbi:MAG: molybdopterin synthase sulfur carrier subunit [Rhodospirillaceae bacterium]|nr:molybdopterin synthase sulfur carrier subunit [Rhodospirillaceae bacterium]|tara:strand:- start:356 stop:607 length:252 start_codon:yes stop_codon:yes gene_type:complete